MNINKAIVVMLIFTVQVYALITFEAGQIAKAEDFNSNFTELDEKINDIKNINTTDGAVETSTSSNGYIPALVNGVNMEVMQSANSLGFYLIKTLTGVSIAVDEEGELISNPTLYYTSRDCSGSPYIGTRLNKEKNEGYIFPNPNLGSSNIQIVTDLDNIFYADYKSLVKLYYSSIKNSSDRSCKASGGYIIATELKPNDMNITGIDKIPAIITGVGTDLKISAEVGDKIKNINGLIVYSDGSRIGATSMSSFPSSFPIRVTLDDYPEQTVIMYKDGSYIGLTFGKSENLYYLAEDCEGTPYVKVLNDFNKEWWIADNLDDYDVVNDGKYYTLSKTIYKMDDGSKSYKYSYNGTCYNSTETGKHGFKKASEISAPNFPTFSTPITIESLEEDIDYNSLSDAD